MKEIEDFLEKELKKGTFPGGVLGVFSHDQVYYQDAFGYAHLEPKKLSISIHTIFDLASLTKVIATATSLMILLEEGEINLYDGIRTYLPKVPLDKEGITLFHLLTHSSGFPAIVQLFDGVLTLDEKIEYILNLPLHYQPGTDVLYSDPNFILLGNIVERVSGRDLDTFTHDQIFSPLGMEKTTFNPKKRFPSLQEGDFAATEWCKWRLNVSSGEVHDKNAYYFGGVSGHAGLFAPLKDLIIFSQMLLKGGLHKGVPFLTEKTVDLLRKDWTPHLKNHRGLGWDLVKNQYSSGGVLFSSHAFGHTGFTGTSIWLDPVLSLGVILLTNRVHPTRDNLKIISCRPKLHNLINTLLYKGKGT